MNPFDLAGPQFLVLFFIGGITTLLVAIGVKQFLIAGTAPKRGLDQFRPEELAYLAGGVERAVEAAVAALNHRGAITIDSAGLKPVDSAPQLSADGVYRGIVDESELTELERFALGEIRQGEKSIRNLVDRARSFEPALSESLVADGLLVADRSGSQLKAMVVPALWSAMGVIKIMVGLSRGKPVGFLVMLVIALLVIAFSVTKAPRRTTEGNRIVRDAKRRYAALETTASTAPVQLSGQDMSFAYAMFGTAVVAPALLPLMPSYQRSLIAPQGASDGSGGGSSCSSSCGGGCGGGCGGCS